jgi:hypothetical protein
MTVIYVCLVIAGVFFALTGLYRVRLWSARRSGLYPPRGAGSISDVQRLIQSGHRVLAVRLYRELHQVSLREARSAVDQLGKERAT